MRRHLRPHRADPRCAWIAERAPGRSFLDIGCLWGVHGKFSFLAEEAGATRVVGMDINPATAEFLAERESRKSQVEFIEADIHSPAIPATIGPIDVVFCCGVLYHSTSPLHLLGNLRSICQERLILRSSVIPEHPGYPNLTIFYPHLPERSRRFWSTSTNQTGLSSPYRPEEHYGAWFYGFSPSALRSMLQCAGFSIEREELSSDIMLIEAVPVASAFIPTVQTWAEPSAHASAANRRKNS